MVTFKSRPSKLKDSCISPEIRVGAAQETTQEKILALLAKQPSITRKKTASAIGISSEGVKYHLAKLTAAGSIRHVGSAKAGYWEILKK